MRRKLVNFIFVIILLIGIGIMLYPTFSDWWNRQHQTHAIAGYVEATKDLSAEKKQEMWNEAQAYNKTLVGKSLNFNLSDEEKKEYEKILDVTGTGIMGYVNIPKINVSLPIYHGTDEATLQIAIGHLPGTSLPVGGESTHCVISGHTGLPSAKLFTDIDQLEVGDHFTLEVLDQTLTYEVDQINVVLPDELEDLEIEEGKDLCTLVTCTPYGINTHRLLVRGHRVTNDDPDVLVDGEPVKEDKYVPIAVLIVLFIVFAIIVGPKRKKRKMQKYLEKEKEAAAGQEEMKKKEETAQELKK